jgi:HSP20 family molecular chaperone IbpA
VEDENSATKDIVDKFDLRFLYIVGAALLVGGLAMAVVQRRKRSTTNIEGGKSGLIDISEDSESAFVAMEMAGFDDTNINDTRNTSTLSSDVYNDIDDVVVEYGVKM